MGFSRQEYWSGLLFPTPGDLPNPGIQLASPVLQEDSLLLSHRGSSANILICPQLIYGFNAIPTKISTHFFFSVDTDKIILKFTWGGKETRKLRYCWIRRKAGAISVLNFKIYIAAIIKTVHIEGGTDTQINGTEQRTQKYSHANMTNWLSAKAKKEFNNNKKICLFNKQFWSNWTFRRKKNEIQPKSTALHKNLTQNGSRT